MTRFTRRLVALLAMTVIVFGQLAVSSYACTMPDRAAMAAMAAMDEGAHCDEMRNANLCERHCDYGASHAQALVVDSIPSLLDIAVPWRTPAEDALPPTPGGRHHGAPAVPHPPPLERFGFLRI